MKLTDLEPEFIRRIDDSNFQHVASIDFADGIVFLCPVCLVNNQMRRPGVHSVICWHPRVPQTTQPTPGRWEFEGTDLTNLTLTPSILLKSTCGAHFFIKHGEIL